jgi:hypothetical protein
MQLEGLQSVQGKNGVYGGNVEVTFTSIHEVGQVVTERNLSVYQCWI